MIRVFATWPKEWDAEFTLLCRSGFLVTSALRKGEVEFVEIDSQFGSECRVRNPWGASEVTLYREGRKSESMKEPLLTFKTEKRENMILVHSGTTPQHFKRRVLDEVKP